MALATKALVFVKDYWAKDDGRPLEPAIYEELEGFGVPHLPDVLFAGDVLDDTGHAQTTLSSQFKAEHADSLSMTIPLQRYRHIRIVQSLSFPLWTVMSSRELVLAIRNTVECEYDLDVVYIHQVLTCLTAIVVADQSQWLHRDVSPDNIMLDNDSVGFLNDWDHGVRVTEGRTVPDTATRSVSTLPALYIKL